MLFKTPEHCLACRIMVENTEAHVSSERHLTCEALEFYGPSCASPLNTCVHACMFVYAHVCILPKFLHGHDSCVISHDIILYKYPSQWVREQTLKQTAGTFPKNPLCHNRTEKDWMFAQKRRLFTTEHFSAVFTRFVKYCLYRDAHSTGFFWKRLASVLIALSWRNNRIC